MSASALASDNAPVERRALGVGLKAVLPCCGVVGLKLPSLGGSLHCNIKGRADAPSGRCIPRALDRVPEGASECKQTGSWVFALQPTDLVGQTLEEQSASMVFVPGLLLLLLNSFTVPTTQMMHTYRYSLRPGTIAAHVVCCVGTLTGMRFSRF